MNRLVGGDGWSTLRDKKCLFANTQKEIRVVPRIFTVRPLFLGTGSFFYCLCLKYIYIYRIFAVPIQRAENSEGRKEHYERTVIVDSEGN